MIPMTREPYTLAADRKRGSAVAKLRRASIVMAFGRLQTAPTATSLRTPRIVGKRAELYRSEADGAKSRRRRLASSLSSRGIDDPVRPTSQLTLRKC
jgi:hypothetical protein